MELKFKGTSGVIYLLDMQRRVLSLEGDAEIEDIHR